MDLEELREELKRQRKQILDMQAEMGLAGFHCSAEEMALCVDSFPQDKREMYNSFMMQISDIANLFSSPIKAPKNRTGLMRKRQMV